MRRLYNLFVCFGLLCQCVLLQAQNNVTVSGTVIDADTKETVIGASVLVTGTTNGTVTDIDGNFSLSAPEGAELTVSYIGYNDYRFTAMEGNFQIDLKPSKEFLQESIVVGYGTVKKENLTGAVDQVNSDVFEGRPASNVTQMLEGAIPNLNISLSDGKPGRTASYNVRGITSIGGGGSALVLIDGVEGDPSLLNPNDIESVSVLKDAASSSIYGSRATYGVVLITTKSAKENDSKCTITYTGNVSFLQPTAIPDIVDDGYVYARLFYDAWYSSRGSQPTGMNKGQEFSRSWMEDFRQLKKDGIQQTTFVQDGKYVYYGNTNYFDYIYKPFVIANTHNLSASGKTKMMDYYLSGRFYNYDGLFNYNPDKYTTFNVRGKANVQLLDWLKISENMDYSYENQHIPSSYSGEGGGNVWRAISDEGHPSSPVFNPDGTLTKSGAYAIGGLVTGNNYDDRLIKIFKTTTALKATFLDNTLSFNADFSFSSRDKNQTAKRTTITYSDAPGVIKNIGTPYIDDYFSEYYSTHHTIATNVFADYENTFAEKHYFKAMLGFNYERRADKTVYVSRNGLLSPDETALNMAVGDNYGTNSTDIRWRTAGFFGRINYSYDDRYLLELNGRYDGSSQFPVNSQWGFFPSGSIAWRPSMEHYWNVDKSIISNLKIRASIGELGNGNVESYSFFEKFSFGTLSQVLDGQSRLRYTSKPSQIPDNLTWETSRTLDAGIDLGFLNGKINVTADIYRRRTYNMYTVGPSLPDTYGDSSPKGNYADMHTDGYEISISYNDSYDLGGHPFNFGIKATLADSRSWIDKYNNPTKKLSDYYEGMEIGDMWGLVGDGLFQSQYQIDNYYGPGIPYTNTVTRYRADMSIVPGDIIFKDLNGNKIIDLGSDTEDDPGDREIVGNYMPRYHYSFNLNFEWNGICLSAFIQGIGKQNWYPSGESPFWGQYNRPYNQALKWMIGNTWTEDNPGAYLPVYTGYYAPFFYGATNSQYMQNAAYIRLKNLQLGYNLPKRWLQKMHLQNVNIYFSGENLFTWSPVYRYTRDFDVVTASKVSDTDVTAGNMGDGFNYPTMRSFSIGLTITY